MKVLLDTCAFIWTVSRPEELGARAVELLEEPHTDVFVSAVSCAEIACLVERGRIILRDRWKTWFNRNVAANKWVVLPIDLETVQEAYSLPTPFHRDPADRLIVATARVKQLCILTSDAKILDYAHVQSEW